ncbi:MAG TPA: tetratricopeptide repeat protein [Caldilineaceae bacterium]|nr:tetratricopeptide repeat protein [Caldilineaceae bacterium]
MAPEPVDQPRASSSLRDRSRQLLLALGTVIAVVGTVMGFLSDTLGVWDALREQLGAPTPAAITPEQSLINNDTFSTTVQTVGLSATVGLPPTATPTVAPAATPTPTPLPVTAAPGETLLLVAQFANYAGETGFNVAGRIQEALEEQIAAAKLTDARAAVWPEAVPDGQHATAVLTETGAAMVIWGEYDSGRVRVKFALPGGALDWQRLAATPDELSTIINLDVPREVQALALMAVGRLYRDTGKLEQAKAAFLAALAQAPSEPDTVATLSFYLGYLYASSRPPEPDEAIAAYSRTIELRPEWYNAHYNRGLVYFDRYWHDGDKAGLDLALADLDTVIARYPRSVDALVNRGIVYYTRDAEGDLARALADLDQAIELDPNSVRGHYNRGLARIRADDRPGWEADLQRALELAPEYVAAAHALCWGYALDNLPELGLPYCEMAAAADSVGYTRDARGLVYAELGRLEEAAADLEIYVEWLRAQPGPWYETFAGSVYADIVAALHAGENPITEEILESLR